MRGFRVTSRVAAMFLAVAGNMLGNDSQMQRKIEQAAWNRDPKTFSEWRLRQQRIAPAGAAFYLNQSYADRARRRYDRANEAKTKAFKRSGRSIAFSEDYRYQSHAEIPTHIKRNVGVPVRG